ncbi:MAG: hypothetical protein HQL04_03895 [Nitrospirae bacterium]|uniref:Magnetosome protein Man3 n=1 Tax=uncultured Nitrospirota bacterium TaxID=170969 RepID=A0A142BU46_9BACT|nr:magnetosome protein Man3 [uncultured Nitrospirota bacterium]MBF0317294.1 hypothetical protein [Nitrospirota bacterium]
MSKIMIGVFLGVFVSALTYEILYRSNPDLIDKIKDKTLEKLDCLLDVS